MGKAARRARKAEESARPKVVPVPFVARPFAGLPGESEWVAMRQLLPAATARLRLRDHDAVRDALGGRVTGSGLDVTVTTLLPASWSCLHREDGERLVALQSGPTRGDASRDVAAMILTALATPAGAPATQVPAPTGATPRLQDIVDIERGFEATLQSGFDYWVPDASALDARAKAELEEANAAIVFTERLPTDAVPTGAVAYWGRMGERAHIRLVLVDDESPATDALARLHAAGADSLGSGTRLLGAFRADGLLIPVWDLDPNAESSSYTGELAAFSRRYAEALASESPLTSDERRARSGMLGRQMTLR